MLIASSTTPAQIDPIDCTVVTGDWVSSYDGTATTSPGDLEIDHVVALEDAHVSGGWRWTDEERSAFANDAANLVAVTTRMNRSKGSRPPDEWRPPRRESWCAMANTWVAIKGTYGLTVTTNEREGLVEMLATCPPAPPASGPTAP